MGNRSGFSAQTLAVLAELCATPSRWRHGYGLAGDTGLKSGTLYPVLIRLTNRGLVEACWEDEQPAGRTRRHPVPADARRPRDRHGSAGTGTFHQPSRFRRPAREQAPGRGQGGPMSWLTRVMAALLRGSAR